MKTNGKKTFGGFLCRLKDWCINCIAHEKNYTQLSFEQRHQIKALLQTGRSQEEIAHQIGVRPSTIRREFRRNAARRGPTAGCYSARKAGRKTTERHAHKATYPLHTLTFANDKVFAGHQAIVNALGLETYFREISHQRVRQVEEFLNNRPVRKFKYKTPNQALQAKIALIT